MFAAPAAPELHLSKHLQRCKLAKGEKVTYSAYRTTRTHVQCVECVWVLHEAGGKGWSIAGATVARKDESGERLLLCHGHARLWKKLDGYGEPRKRASRRGRR
jgi:hypothetical protein